MSRKCQSHESRRRADSEKSTACGEPQASPRGRSMLPRGRKKRLSLHRRLFTDLTTQKGCDQTPGLQATNAAGVYPLKVQITSKGAAGSLGIWGGQSLGGGEERREGGLARLGSQAPLTVGSWVARYEDSRNSFFNDLHDVPLLEGSAVDCGLCACSLASGVRLAQRQAVGVQISLVPNRMRSWHSPTLPHPSSACCSPGAARRRSEGIQACRDIKRRVPLRILLHRALQPPAWSRPRP